MRIIGGHDYFDGAMGYGIDKTVVFNRTSFAETPCTPRDACRLRFPRQECVALNGIEQYRGYKAEYVTKNHFLATRTMSVWFAGVRYGGIYACLTHKRTHERTHHYFWDHDTFVIFIRQFGAQLDEDGRWISRTRFRAKSLKEHFSDRGSDTERDWLIRSGISIAIMDISRGNDEDGWRFDCDGLKDIGFAKVLDAYAAFQNLAQWVGGVLPRPTVPTIEITDEKTKLMKHGMDKWSFKTMPQPKN